MSRRLTVLTKEVARLRKLFLPDPFDSVGNYPDMERVQAHTRAFLVLIHAEFETYFEDWAKDLARASEVVWNRRQRITQPLAFLLSWSSERLEPPQTLSPPAGLDSAAKLAAIVTKLYPRFYKRIKDNNGVKEGNILALFGPLGVAQAAFAPSLLPSLDAFGAQRGVHAHQSAKAVITVLDPETEFKRAEQLLGDIALFDTWATRYRSRIR